MRLITTTKKMEFSISYQSLNYEVLKLNVACGGFRTSLFILNVDDISCSEELRHIASGNFGSVYEAYSRSQRYAIKRTPIK